MTFKFALPLVLLVTALTFPPVLSHDFTNWDDPANILENQIVMSPSLEGLRHVWAKPINNMYSPLVFTTFMLDRIIGHGSPTAFHVSNLLLHLGSVTAVFLLLRLIAPSSNVWPAAAGALLFAIHPLQAEPVSWATGRKDLLAGCLGLFAVYLQLRSNKPDAPSRNLRIAAFLAFSLSLFAKATATPLPLVVIAIEVLLLNVPLRKSALQMLPWFTVAAVIGGIAIAAQPLPEWLQKEVPLSRRPLLAGYAIGFYVMKVFWQFPLSPVYQVNAVDAANSKLSVLCLILLILAATVLVATKQKRLSALAIVFVAPLLPVAGIVPFLYQSVSLTADRYAYVSLLAPALALAWLLQLKVVSGRNEQAMKVVVVCFGLLLCFLCNRQSRIWRNSETLWTHAVRVSPGVPEAHTNLGFALHHRGDLLGAEKQFELAVKADPNFSIAWNMLGLLQLERAGPDVALPALRENIRSLIAKGHRGQRLAMAYSNLSAALLRKKDYTAAEEAARTSLKISPSPEAKENLKEALQKGRPG